MTSPLTELHPLPATLEKPLSRALKSCKRHFVWAAVFSALLNLLFIAPMLYMLQVYDRVVPAQGTVTLVFLTILLVAALATLSLLDYVRSRILVRASVRLDQELAGAILDTTLSRSEQAGQKLTRQALREFDVLRQALTGPAILALFDFPWTPIYILICFLIHPLVGILALIGAALLLLLAWRNDKATRLPLQRANDAAGITYARQDQSAAAADVVRALGMRRAMVGQHLREREQMLALQTEASFGASGFIAASKFLRLLLQSLALGLGALLVIDNQITAGAIFAAMFMVGRALAPIDQLMGAWRGIVQARGAYGVLEQLFDTLPEPAERTLLPPPQGRLRAEHLSSLTPGRDRQVLHNVSFSVEPGEAIAIVGPSGAGKSTLAAIIAGAVLPEQGTVRLDGANQNDWDPERLAAHVGYMAQEPKLFSGTIKENIARFRNGLELNRTDADAAVISAAQLAGAHELILSLPGGYDYELGLGGRGLSIGQAQRVALARALFGNPRYLILDEPNAHLDAESDLQLGRTLKDVKEAGATILIVAHKLGILPVVDKLLVLRDGKLELYGPRDEVMRRIAPARPIRPVAKAVKGKVAQ